MIPLGGMSRAHDAGGVAPFLVPDESRSVAAADVFVEGEMEARKQQRTWLEIGEWWKGRFYSDAAG